MLKERVYFGISAWDSCSISLSQTATENSDIVTGRPEIPNTAGKERGRERYNKTGRD